MKTYLVGGAVRDELLNLPVTERDWVVIDASSEEMLNSGFKSVGKDFPVFLHPTTGEEYALARTERKIGPGHTGFQMTTGNKVTLEEDLMRRDLTINAIAKDEGGRLIDPWGGMEDIQNRILKHVSPAFEEDPLRVLRLARFASRFHSLGFSIEPSTTELAKKMVLERQLEELPPERIWTEMEKALSNESPFVFFQVLDDFQALDYVLPGLEQTGISLLKALSSAHRQATDRFALLVYSLSSTEIKSICHRLKIPNSFRELAMMIADHLQKWKDSKGLSASSLVGWLNQLDALRRPERFHQFNELCFSIVQLENKTLAEDNLSRLKRALDIVSHTGIDSLKGEKRRLSGALLGDAIREEQAIQLELQLNTQEN